MTTETTTKKYLYSLHHTNVPITNIQRTADWYGSVFGMTPVSIRAFVPDATTLLMSNGNFHLHFELYPEVEIPLSQFDHRTGQHLFHTCVEVVDWDEMVAHLDELGIEQLGFKHRPQDGSKSATLIDPDGHVIEIAWHADRDW